jgi:oligoendopeptidase F
MAKTIPERKDVAEQDKWKLEDLYPTAEDWKRDLKDFSAVSEELGGFSGRLGTADGLLAYLRLTEKAEVYLEKLLNYAQRRSDEDTRDAFCQGLVGQATKAWVELGENTSYAVPELLEITDEEMEQLYKAQPELTLYRRHLDDIRRLRAHVLSKKEERLLAAAGELAQSPDQIYSVFADADLKFRSAADQNGELRPITQGSYISCLESPDRTLRKNAFESYYESYGNFKNTVAGTLSAQVKQLEFFARARRYDTALQASLDATDVPVSVYDNLIEAVHGNMDKMYRYVRLRKKLMGLDELHMYDIYTPLVPDADEKIPFEQAKQTVLQALAPMGEDYLAILKEGFANRWIDVYENAGKRSGAYSAGTPVHPYVLLNHTGTLDSLFTLAHEMGHAIHSYLSAKHQPVVYQDYVIFVAEVASTCNEALLMEYLLSRTTDRRKRAYLINHFLEQFKSTLYRQTMFAEFERRIAELNREGTTLTADVLCAEYRKLNELYFGPDIVLDRQIELEWARIPHFYYNYYVFQYATGYSAAVALSRKILQEGKPEVDRYLGFLSGGCSKSPIELLKGAGVDMTSPQPVEDALRLFDTLLDEMEELTGK